MIKNIISTLVFVVGVLAVICMTRRHYPLYKLYLLGFINVALIVAWIFLYIIIFTKHNKLLIIINAVIFIVILFRLNNLNYINNHVFNDTEPSLKYYHQNDSRWADIRYGLKTIGRNGCGAAVAAMVVSSLASPETTPAEAAEYALKHNFVTSGTEIGFIYKYFSLYKIKFKVIQKNDTASVRKLLENKRWILAVIKPLTIARKTHYVIIRKINGDYIQIADPDNFADSLRHIRLSDFLNKCSTDYPFVAVEPIVTY